ncbi:uncharacterized protein A4U43_C04F34360 [Asparagus officinalis]|uniref:Uncharacterized protein n=1 Tax=Asparagus officinalis TaxID=4686 RepID=A0A5P1FB02_ASPOF|nr:uncharacterized protein A4U43_C04F34360 [Asparagus officinalis]
MSSCFISCFCGSPGSDGRQKDQRRRSSNKKAVLLQYATTAEFVGDGSIVISETKSTPVRRTPSDKTIQRAKKRSGDSEAEGWLLLLAMPFVSMINLDARLLAVLWLSAWFYFSPFLQRKLAGKLGFS